MGRRMLEFVSLNGPDHVGKTTQIRLLADRIPGVQPLGSVHEHDREAWDRVARTDYARWWFEQSSTEELTRMLLTSHRRRSAARSPNRLALLDRGFPMLVAVAAATCTVRDGLDTSRALRTVNGIAADMGSFPDEFSVLLLPARDVECSLRITSSRAGRPWTGVYPEYQAALHAVLVEQARRGVYTHVIECGDRTADAVHDEILAAVRNAMPGAWSAGSR